MDQQIGSLNHKNLDSGHSLPLIKGTNIGHWLSQSALDRNQMAHFFNEEDVKWIADRGFDHIRLPVDYPLLTQEGASGWNSEGFSWVERGIEWCLQRGLKVVLDLHCLPGHHFNSEYQNFNLIWQKASPQRKKANLLWQRLAEKISHSDVALELLNEPVAQHHEDWNILAQELHASIRSVNKESWILVASNRWNQVSTFPALNVIQDPKTLYTFHFYEPHLFTHQLASWEPRLCHLGDMRVPYPGPCPSEILATEPTLEADFKFMTEQAYGKDYMKSCLQPVLEFRDKHGKQIYCGEFGALFTAPLTDRLHWYSDLLQIFKEENIGFANWNYKSHNFGLRRMDGSENRELIPVFCP